MHLDELFTVAADQGASDLHLVVGQPPLLRVDGQLRVIAGREALTRSAMEALVTSILTEAQREAFLRRRELDLSHEITDRSRFRVNLHWEKDNMGLVARVIPTAIPSLADLGMPPVVSRLLRRPSGLILLTGPTGCGKSTTLAAMIRAINEERQAHIVTLEDPIEFIHPSLQSILKQRQLGTDMLSFAEGLKHVLRQDPNVIMVGEMRDLETIAATITLAETGHLVLATLHTHDATQTIDRIIDIFPPSQQPQVRLQLSLSLSAVISQRLLPRQGGGRIAVREILLHNAAVANTIRENKIPQLRSILQTHGHEGMVTLEQAIQEAATNGWISEEVAAAYREA